MSLDFIHRFEPPTTSEDRTLLMLHGTGGDEHDLVPLGQSLLPGAAILSPRGRVSEEGMLRFFRRFEEGVFDLDSIRTEASALAEFISEASEMYQFDPAKVVAVGFSNGANIAHSLLSLHPQALSAVVAIRAMTTLPDFHPTGLDSKRVFISSGKSDPIVPIRDVESLARQLSAGGAQVTHHWVDAGHNLTRSEIVAIAEWLGG
jgi:predicted esterase